MERLLALLKNGHTRMGSYPGKRFFRPRDYGVLFINNDFILTHKNTIKGEIMSIDGEDPKKILAYHIRRISSSKKRYAIQKALGFLLTHYEEKPINVIVKKQNGEKNEITLLTKPIESKKQENNVIGEIIQKNIGYIKISSWVDMGGLSNKINEHINNIVKHPIAALIIDVRGNGGGDSRIACKFASHFFDKKVIFGVAQQRIAGKNIFKACSVKVMPRKPYISKPVIILTDEACLSSNEIFIAGMKDNKRAFLIGEETGGSSGNPKKYIIPFGEKKCELFVSTWNYFRKNGKKIEGRGVRPDIHIKISFTDLSRRQDPVLKRAVMYVKSLQK